MRSVPLHVYRPLHVSTPEMRLRLRVCVCVCVYMCVCAYLCLVCVPVESAVTRLCADVTVHMHVIGGSREERVMITCSVIGLSALISFDLFYFFFIFYFYLFYLFYLFFCFMWMACLLLRDCDWSVRLFRCFRGISLFVFVDFGVKGSSHGWGDFCFVIVL